MYFSENLETCTIGWVSFCKGGVGLFYFFGGDGTDRAGLGGGYIPRRCTPAHSSAPGQTAQHRQQGRPCQNQGGQIPGQTTPCTDTHARTLDTLHRSALDTRQTARGDRDDGGAGWRAVCPKLCRFVHSVAVQKYISFLNTFVARATENPFTVSQKCDIIMSQE